MKYIENNIPKGLRVHVHHWHHGNQVDLSNGGARYVTHAWLEDKHGHMVSEGVAVAHGRSKARATRPVRRQMAVGRAFKHWHQQMVATYMHKGDEANAL